MNLVKLAVNVVELVLVVKQEKRRAARQAQDRAFLAAANAIIAEQQRQLKILSRVNRSIKR
ncbi:hypothetical protein AH06_143 [Erwinia phage AH06]|nr:hypothetical protein AH06_143 [Erwinia phage AH06]